MLTHSDASACKGSSFFWRTFLMLILLITLSVLGGLQTYWTFNELPVARSISMQIVSMTNLTRFALVTADPLYRPDLLSSLASQEIRILPKEPDDDVLPLKKNPTVELIEHMVETELGQGTVLASKVNGEPGLWVSIAIDGDEYWLMTRKNLFEHPTGTSWLWWAAIAFMLSMIGAAQLTRHTVEPLARLSRAARALGHGELPEELPADKGPEEIREVNRSFNAMVKDLASMEEDRELLLAGVSHDLRTPITRLRLEVELAGLPDDSREAMVQDLEQMENIVNQFLAYARRATTPLELVNLGETVANAIASSRFEGDPKVSLDCVIRKDVFIMAHPVEIERVVQNLLVNAGRYGRGDDGRLEVFVTAGIQNGQAILSVSDHGKGLPESEMTRVLRPFERGERARTGSTGSGLGLAIVDRIAKRSGGLVRLVANKPTGLSVEIRFPLASPPKPAKKTKKDKEADKA